MRSLILVVCCTCVVLGSVFSEEVRGITDTIVAVPETHEISAVTRGAVFVEGCLPQSGTATIVLYNAGKRNMSILACGQQIQERCDVPFEQQYRASIQPRVMPASYAPRCESQSFGCDVLPLEPHGSTTLQSVGRANLIFVADPAREKFAVVRPVCRDEPELYATLQRRLDAPVFVAHNGITMRGCVTQQNVREGALAMASVALTNERESTVHVIWRRHATVDTREVVIGPGDTWHVEASSGDRFTAKSSDLLTSFLEIYASCDSLQPAKGDAAP